MQLLTAIVTSFNEETMIRDCLATLQFADEILRIRGCQKPVDVGMNSARVRV